jgi:hypothetical protein
VLWIAPSFFGRSTTYSRLPAIGHRRHAACEGDWHDSHEPAATVVERSIVVAGPPPLPLRYYSRPTGLEAIAAATQPLVAVLCAATGTGKTTSAAEYCDSGADWGWVDLRGYARKRSADLRERPTPAQRIPDLRTSTATLRGFPPRRLWIDRAGMFDLGMRQKDMIGEWVPRSEPGVTDVFSGGSKWLMSARWEEIDEQFVWKHRLSKSVTREGIMELETGKTELFETLEFPPSCQRAHPGRPFCRFRDRSRKIARARAEHRERVANGIANK